MGEILNNLGNSLEFIKWALVFLMTLVLWRNFSFPSIRWIWIAWAIYLIAKPLSWVIPIWSMDMVDYGGEPISPEVFKTTGYAVYSMAMRLSYLLTPLLELLIVVIFLGDLGGLLEKQRADLKNGYMTFLAWVRNNVTPIGIAVVVLAVLSNGLTLFLPIWASLLFRGTP